MSGTLGTPHASKIANAKITINDLLKERDDSLPVYVVNTSDLKSSGRSRKKGEVLLTIHTGQGSNGGMELVSIPVTWIPIDLTEYVPRKMVLESAEFRRALTSGVLTLINAATANEILKTPQAQSELRSIIMRKEGIDSESMRTPNRVTEPDNDVAKRILQDRQQRQQQNATATRQQVSVMPEVVNLMGNQDMRPSDRITALTNIGDNMTEVDLHYVISMSNSATDNEVISWAHEGINTIRNSGE